MVLETEQHKTTLWATIDRPSSLNAVNFEVMRALEKVLEELEESSDIRVFVLSGAGRNFISGGDLKEFHTLSSQEEAEAMSRRMNRILKRIETLPCWTIACVNGPAYGGGCEMMLAFDFRIASENASFGFTQGRFYLPPGWGGLTRLMERVGRSTALKWLAETAVVGPDEALQHKLLDRVEAAEALYEATLEWAQKLGHNDRNYIQTLKEGGLRFAGHRWEAIEREIEPFTQFWVDGRHQKRVQRFLRRKKSGQD